MLLVLPVLLPLLYAGCGNPAVNVPARLDGVEIKSLGGGSYGLCALLLDGTGTCLSGEPGTSWDKMTDSEPFARAGFLNGAKSLVPGDEPCAIFEDGTLRCDLVETALIASDVAQAIQPSGSYTGSLCYVTNDGAAACSFAFGEPRQLPLDGARATQIAATSEAVCVLLDGGSVRCWKAPLDGDGMPINQFDDWLAALDSPGELVPDLAGATEMVLAGDWRRDWRDDAGFVMYGCAIVIGGLVKCWGENDGGQLGDGTTTPSDSPVTVIDRDNDDEPLTDVIAVGVGNWSSCALTGDGSVHCWGASIFDDGLGARRIPGVDEAKALTVGTWGLSCALREDDTAICWGAAYKESTESCGLRGVSPPM
nr:Regulator of chromosome condensation (RCC1) repeat [uncultured bacterium]